MAERAMLVSLAVTVLPALTAGVALAKTIRGTRGADYLDGTPRADEISGRDDIDGRNGDDKMGDPDYPDMPDVVWCGPGTADKADSDDDVADDRERVELVGAP